MLSKFLWAIKAYMAASLGLYFFHLYLISVCAWLHEKKERKKKKKKKIYIYIYINIGNRERNRGRVSDHETGLSG